MGKEIHKAKAARDRKRPADGDWSLSLTETVNISGRIGNASSASVYYYNKLIQNVLDFFQ